MADTNTSKKAEEKKQAPHSPPLPDNNAMPGGPALALATHQSAATSSSTQGARPLVNDGQYTGLSNQDGTRSMYPHENSIPARHRVDVVVESSEQQTVRVITYDKDDDGKFTKPRKSKGASRDVMRPIPLDRVADPENLLSGLSHDARPYVRNSSFPKSDDGKVAAQHVRLVSPRSVRNQTPRVGEAYFPSAAVATESVTSASSSSPVTPPQSTATSMASVPLPSLPKAYAPANSSTSPATPGISVASSSSSAPPAKKTRGAPGTANLLTSLPPSSSSLPPPPKTPAAYKPGTTGPKPLGTGSSGLPGGSSGNNRKPSGGGNGSTRL